MVTVRAHAGRLAALWILALALLTLTLLIVPLPPFAVAVAWVIAELAAAALTFVAARRSNESGRWVWTALGLGLLLNAIGAAMSALTSSDHAPVRDTMGSPADVVVLISYALLMVGGTLALRASRANRDAAAVLDGLVVLVAGAMLASHFIVVPAVEAGDSGTDLWPLAINILVGLALIGLAVRLWFSTSSSRQRATRWIAIGMVALGSADLVLLAARNSPELALSVWSQVAGAAYLLFLLLMGLAALDPSRDDFSEASSTRGLSSPTRTVVMLLVALLTPLVVLVSDQARGGDLDSNLLAPITGVLVALVGARILLLVRAFNQASIQARVLHEVSSDTLADPADLARRLPDWATQLTGRADLAPMLLTPAAAATHPGLTIIASSTEGAGAVLVATGARAPHPAEREGLQPLAEAIGLRLERLAMRETLIDLAAESRASQLLANSADAIVVVDEDLIVHYATPALETLSRATTPPVGLHLGDVLPNTATEELSTLVWRSMAGGKPRASLTASSGQDDHHLDAIAVWLPESRRCVLTLRDVTEHHQLRTQLADRAFYDQLTGLANRELFRDRLSRAVSRHQRYGTPFAVLMLDVDDFKSVNDTLGHPAGDELLCAIAQRISAQLRGGDTAARLGGDEFTLILEGTATEAEAGVVATRLLDRLAEPFTIDGREIIPRASIGIALARDGKSATELERSADLALYEAKGCGKGRWSAYHPDLHSEAVRRLTLVSELREAIPRGEILPWYQPIVDLSSGQVVGVEALARWESPVHGLVQPLDFIPAAEESGLIVELGAAILRKSLLDVAAARRDRPDLATVSLSVNLAPRQMQDPHLVAHVRDALAVSGIAAEHLVLEITESTLLPGEGVRLERLEELRAMGVRVSIDDFGTGWSSLGYLRTLPVDSLKLAREFVQNLPHPSDLGLVTAVRDLAVNLGLEEVVAEGIETVEQRDALIERGYRLGQGYLFGRPAASLCLATTLIPVSAASYESPASTV